jgi:predicted membrane metal-binding protein
MQWRLSLVFLFSIILFSLPSTPSRTYKKRASSPIGKSIKNKTTRLLLKSYVLGEKRGLSKKIIQDFKALNLMHLFTPSGLHMSSVLLILSFVLKRLPWLQIVLCLLPFGFGGFYAIKRLCLLRLICILNKKLPYKLDIFWLFIIVFSLDFIFGTYSQSPMSFSASFLFLGILFSLKDNNVFTLAWGFFSGQVLLAYFFHEPFTHLGFIPGFILTAIFSLLFPFYLIGLLIPYPGLQSIVLSYLWLVQKSSLIIQYMGWSFATLPFLAFIFLSFTRWRRWGLIFLMFHSNPLLNFEIRSYKYPKAPNFNIEEDDIAKLKRTKSGYSLKLKNGDRCSSQLIPIGYYLTCY